MRFQGRVYRDGRFWLAEVPLFEAMTQGRTRREALAMIADWFETMIDHSNVHRHKNVFEVSSPDLRSMISLGADRQVDFHWRRLPNDLV